MQETSITSVASKRTEDGMAEIAYRTDTVATGQESSVEISQNSKGEPRVSVKVYHADALKAAVDAVTLYKDVILKLQR